MAKRSTVSKIYSLLYNRDCQNTQEICIPLVGRVRGESACRVNYGRHVTFKKIHSFGRTDEHLADFQELPKDKGVECVFLRAFLPLSTETPSLGGRTIEIVVGREPVTCVHEKVICAPSKYFEKALSGGWKEAKECSFQLEEEDPESFQLYLHWLYRRTLPTRIDEPGYSGNAEYLQLAKAYILRDRLQDGSFQDVILDAIVNKCRTRANDGSTWFPVGPVIEHIYQNTTDSSKARRLLTDLYVCHGSGDWLREWIEPSATPKDFLFDLATGFLDKRKVDLTANATTACIISMKKERNSIVVDFRWNSTAKSFTNDLEITMA